MFLYIFKPTEMYFPSLLKLENNSEYFCSRRRLIKTQTMVEGSLHLYKLHKNLEYFIIIVLFYIWMHHYFTKSNFTITFNTMSYWDRFTQDRQ